MHEHSAEDFIYSWVYEHGCLNFPYSRQAQHNRAFDTDKWQVHVVQTNSQC